MDKWLLTRSKCLILTENIPLRKEKCVIYKYEMNIKQWGGSLDTMS